MVVSIDRRVEAFLYLVGNVGYRILYQRWNCSIKMNAKLLTCN